jgi:aminoglycoside phosphotransferase (APT) family kinase protein
MPAPRFVIPPNGVARICCVLPDQAKRWVLEVFGDGSRLVRARHPGVGDWHVNHLLTVVDARGRDHRVVLRRWARSGWESDDPDYTVAREVRVLELLRSSVIPVPAVIAADLTGGCCDVPAVLLTRLPGHSPGPADRAGDGFCRQLAETLAAIHDFGDSARSGLDPYRLYYDRANAELPDWIPPTATWKRAISIVRQPPPATAMILIHRDYHPENTLWSRRRLTGVVDWTQASSGPAGLDLGHMRWNLVLDHGLAVASRFLAAYQAAIGRAVGDQPYWDLVSLFDLLLDRGDGPGDIDADDLRKLENYAGTVIATVAGSAKSGAQIS